MLTNVTVYEEVYCTIASSCSGICMHGLVFVMHGLTTFLQLTFVPVKISFLLKIYSALLSGASSGVVG